MVRNYVILKFGDNEEYNSLFSYVAIPERDFVSEWEEANREVYRKLNEEDIDPEQSTTEDTVKIMKDNGWDIEYLDYEEISDYNEG